MLVKTRHCLTILVVSLWYTAIHRFFFYSSMHRVDNTMHDVSFLFRLLLVWFVRFNVAVGNYLLQWNPHFKNCKINVQVRYRQYHSGDSSSWRQKTPFSEFRFYCNTRVRFCSSISFTILSQRCSKMVSVIYAGFQTMTNYRRHGHSTRSPVKKIGPETDAAASKLHIIKVFCIYVAFPYGR